MDLSVTTTATSRPEILERTYSSFCSHIEGLSQCPLYLNIDSVPKGVNPEILVNISKKYFPNVHWQCPKKPNFTRAVHWLWKQANSAFIFHLEDDWEITENVSLDSLFDLFHANNRLLQIRLSHKVSIGCPYGLSPSIISYKFYKHFVGRLNYANNPEGQLKGFPEPAVQNITIQRYPSDHIIIQDIGREWRGNHGIAWKDIKGKKVQNRGAAMTKFVSW